MTLIEDFESQFVAHGYRLTPQRRTIIRATIMLGAHVDADSIVIKVKQLDSSIGIATVYRTLVILTACGLLSQRQSLNERRNFEVARTDTEHHDHLTCSQCGRVVEFFEPGLEQLQAEIAKRLGFRLEAHRMELVGSCLQGDSCPHKKGSKAK